MKDKLVSLLTPCYNMERYIRRLLDSVVSQTYPYIEMFVIDDGSIDRSAEIIKSYIPLFEERGYRLFYRYQPNSGQSVAIKNGLQLINGEYLAWPDSDDFFSSNESISKMVESLDALPAQYGIVRCCQKVVDEKTLMTRYIQGQESVSEDLFEACLYCKDGFYWGAGAYMVRMSALKRTTSLDIYSEKDAGQNWQLFLPVFYSYKCFTIKDVLYAIVDRTNSHGRGAYSGYEKLLVRKRAYENTILGTLDRMLNISESERNRYKLDVQGLVAAERMDLAYKYKDFQGYLKEYKWLKLNKRNIIKAIDSIRYCAIRIKAVNLLDHLIECYNKLNARR